MSPATAERAALAAIGRDLATNTAGRRATAWLNGSESGAAPRFADLALAPDWLRASRDDHARLARMAAVFALAPALAASIDGAWLGRIARAAGEQALDRALAFASDTPAGGVATVPAEDIEALGLDLLRATLPPVLHSYLDPATTGRAIASPELARFARDHALAISSEPVDVTDAQDMAA